MYQPTRPLPMSERRVGEPRLALTTCGPGGLGVGFQAFCNVERRRIERERPLHVAIDEVDVMDGARGHASHGGRLRARL